MNHPAFAARSVIDGLYRISSAATDTDDPARALERIIDEIMGVLPADGASILLVNPDTGALEIAASRGAAESARGLAAAPGDGTAEWVALHRKPLVVDSVAEDLQCASIPDAERSKMAAPMEEHGVVIGVVHVESRRTEAFTNDDLNVLTLLTGEATRVLGQLWMIQKLKVQAAHFEGLVRAGRHLASTHNLQSILEGITREALEIMGCRLCALFLYDATNGLLRLEAMSGGRMGQPCEEELRLQDSALGTVIQRRRQVEVTDLLRVEEHHFTEVAAREGLVSMLATPITYETEVIGVLNAYTDHTHRFTNAEREILALLASLGAVSIQNARLYARVFAGEETLRRNERLTTLGLLSAEIAHEVRNPLTVLKLLFEGLELDFPGNDVRSRDVSVIGEKLNQLETIVSRVLEFGKSREGMHSRYDLGSLLEDCLHLVRMKLLQSGVRLKIELPHEPIPVHANKGQLQQAFLNIIINALQAMPQGGDLRVSLQREPDESGARAAIEFADTGSGIPDSVRAAVFDSFLTGRGDGTGLGLGIVKRIMRTHNGDVSLVSSGPEGSIFRLWLPVAAR